jgi:isorenieratene synthase
MSISRRRFLKWAGLGAGAGLLGLGGAIAWMQPRRRRLPVAADDASRPEHARDGRRVVVIGGGLAGLAAGIELAARHFDVTLLERAPHLGGKLGGWPVRALGEEFPVEHGFHGFFSQYYNLREILAAAGVADGDLAESPGYPVLFGDRAPETFGRTTPLFPFNLLSVVGQSSSLRLRDFVGDQPALLEMMRYDEARSFGRFDGIDFARFAREGRINRPMVETVLEPFGKTTLNRLERLSAAEAIRFFHFYFMGNPEGLGFRYLKRDSMSAVIEPLRRRFESLGGKLQLGLGASLLQREGGRIRRVHTDPQPETPEHSFRVELANIPERGFLPVPQEDGSSVFIGRRDGKPFALDGRCTHMGCPVTFDADAQNFLCPCHGGRFDASGKPIAGPPRTPLLPFDVDSTGQVTNIRKTPDLPPTFECDYCVVACEVRGARRLLASVEEVREGVASLGEADPYLVLRVWLDRPVRPERAPFYTTSRLRYTDSIALYSVFQEPFISWAKRQGGSVVEIHAYAIAPENDAPASKIRAVMLDEMVQLLPELRGARVLHEEAQRQANFTRWAPGDFARRPSTETAIPNLVLAGDWVRLPAPAALMEAAALSGRLAANAIFRREGVRQTPIWTVPVRGPLA